MRVRVSESWDASYARPIVVRAGGRLEVSGAREVWDGFTWLWAKSESGREGWIPDDLAIETPTGLVARADYSAIELTCIAGAELDVLRQMHGWAWCRDADGQEGWVPVRNLTRADQRKMR